MTFGARVLEIAFDSEPMSAEDVKVKLRSISPFAERTRPQDPRYRWAISVALHPITQDAHAARYVGMICAALGVPPETPIAWDDVSERPTA